MLLLLLGCSETGLTKDDPADVDGDTPICPAYSGFHDAGQTWSLASDGEVTDATIHVELTGLDGADLTLTTDTTLARTDFSATIHRVSDWRCDDDGAWLVAETLVVHQEATGAYPYTLDDDQAYSYAPDGWLLVPAGLDSGSSWDVAFTMEMQSTTYGDSSQDWEGVYFAENEEEVEVPAGTFTTLEINGAGTLDGDTATWSDHDYRHADIGLVLDETLAALTGWTE